MMLLQFALAASAAAGYVVQPSDGAAAIPTGYVVQPSDGTGGPTDIRTFVLKNAGGSTPASVPSANGYLAIAAGGADAFRVYGPEGGDPCGTRVETHVSAKGNKCRYATNGGPFNMSNGNCDAGVFIMNGVVQGTGGWGSPMFGVTAKGEWVAGYMNEASATKLGVAWALSGFEVLVKNGINVADTGTYRAPRTTIGTNAKGELLLLEVDGCEPQKGCAYALGKTNHEMAELLIQHGAVNAVNLDGGGSSTVVANGTLINLPTDGDMWPQEGERAVTTITCIL